jgi:hypothetical protein
MSGGSGAVFRHSGESIILKGQVYNESSSQGYFPCPQRRRKIIAYQNQPCMSAMKQYGIRITLPADNTMTMSHLLGKDWESYRWYDSPEERDRAFVEMRSQPFNYRIGDTIQNVWEKVERNP